MRTKFNKNKWNEMKWNAQGKNKKNKFQKALKSTHIAIKKIKTKIKININWRR